MPADADNHSRAWTVSDFHRLPHLKGFIGIFSC